jgi:hypothetical protein
MNFCINENFSGPNKIAEWKTAVNAKCLVPTTAEELKGKKVTCESCSEYTWTETIGILSTCFMKKKTSIDEPGATIANDRNGSTKGLNFFENKNIFYLPENVTLTFPNLIAYGASMCNVKTIAKKNFKDLIKLRWLGLHGNQIKKIAFDTFEDLKELEFLKLGKITFRTRCAVYNFMKLFMA